MNILDVSNSSVLLESYNSSSLKKVQINVTTNKEHTDISLKELNAINKGKHLAIESLNATYNSNINKKIQESLERKLSQLKEIKNMIENKDKKNDTVENTEVNSNIKSTEKLNDKKETLLSEDEQTSLKDIDKKISETNNELKEIRVLAEELSKESELIDERIYMFKKMYGNDVFKMAEKEAILKQVYDTRNNPLIKELKSTFNEIIELEAQLKDQLNKDQAEDKKEI